MTMTYTYYYGVMCVGLGCDAFISIKSYTTNVKRGVQDVDIGQLALKCDKCGFCFPYTGPVVYSQSPTEMVPLDRELP